MKYFPLMLLGLAASNPVVFINRLGCPIISDNGVTVMGITPALDEELVFSFQLNNDEVACGTTVGDFVVGTDNLRLNQGNVDVNNNNFAFQVQEGGTFENANGDCENGTTTSDARGGFGAVSYNEADSDIEVSGTTVTVVGIKGNNQASVDFSEPCTITFANVVQDGVDEGDGDDDNDDNAGDNVGNAVGGDDDDFNLMGFLIGVIAIVGIVAVAALFVTNRKQDELQAAAFGKF